MWLSYLLSYLVTKLLTYLLTDKMIHRGAPLLKNKKKTKKTIKNILFKIHIIFLFDSGLSRSDPLIIDFRVFFFYSSLAYFFYDLLYIQD